MISKNEIKYIQSLHQKKVRDQENQFIIEGPKLIDELLQSDFKIKKIYATNGNWLQSHAHIELQEITPETLQKISHFESPNQVLAVVEKKTWEILAEFPKKWTILLDGIQDPGNLGTIIRIADWFGVHQIIASNDCVDLYNPKVVHSTMGSIFRIPVHYQNLEEFLGKTKLPVYAALLSGEDMHKITYSEYGILIIGNESKGISSHLLPYINKAVTIPRYGRAESLNAAVATGILLAQMVK